MLSKRWFPGRTPGASPLRASAAVTLLVAASMVLMSGAGLAFADAPPISGLTATPHTDEDVWYSNASPLFAWESAPGIDGFSYSLDNNPTDPLLDDTADALSFNLTLQDPNLMSGTPARAVTADFDGDGNLDVAVSTWRSQNGVEVFFGYGNGYFDPGTSFELPATSDPWDVVAADFNGDGLPDLAATEAGPVNAISIWLNQGDRSFAAGSTYPLPGPYTLPLAVGDINNDGKADLVTGRWWEPSSVAIFKGNGDPGGTFMGPENVSLPGRAIIAVAIGDVTGDAYPDIVVGDHLGWRVTILTNGPGGGGDFTGPPIDVAAGYGVYDIAIGDFNADGRNDIVTANIYYRWDDAMTMLLNQGGGLFARSTVQGALGGDYWGISARDMDGDGKLDIVGSNSDQATVDVFFNDGTGTLVGPSRYEAYNDSGDIVTGDFNNDGLVDVLATQYSGPGIVALLRSPAKGYENLADGIWYFHLKGLETEGTSGPISDRKVMIDSTAPVVSMSGVTDGGAFLPGSDAQVTISAVDPNMPDASGVYEVSYRDSSGDYEDSVIGDELTFDLPSDPGVYTFYYSATDNAGNESASDKFVVTIVGEVADLSSDTHPDQEAWYLETIAGFTWGTIPGGSYSYSVDHDPDGEPDLVADRVTATSILMNPRTYPTHYDAQSIATGDFDEDGHQDYAVGLDDDSGVTIHLNNGDATFETDWGVMDEDFYYDTGTYTDDLHVADMNVDGHQDVVYVNDAYSVGILWGNGDGTFDEPVEIPTADIEYPEGIAIADLNGDDTLDIAVAGGDEYFEIMFGNGLGDFTISTFNMWEGAYADGSIAAGDMNGDDAPDLVFSADNGYLVVALNSGEGDFSSDFMTEVEFVEESTTMVRMADFDEDGNLDVVASAGPYKAMYLGDGAGGLSQAWMIGDFEELRFGDDFTIGDINADGNLDVVLLAPDADVVLVLVGDGTGEVELGGVAYVDSLRWSGIGIASDDFDGDGYDDVAAAGPSENVHVLMGADGATHNASVGPLDDGVWYFHVRQVGGEGDDAVGGPVQSWQLNIGEEPASIAEDDYVTSYSRETTVSPLENDENVGSLDTVGDPPNGSITREEGNDYFIYTPDEGFLGEDSFTYTTTKGASATVYVTVEPGIGAPSGLAATVLSTTSARIDWVAPADVGSGLAGYYIQWRVLDGEWNSTERDDDPTLTSWTLTGLEPGEYEYRVVAYDSEGYEASEADSFVIDEEVPVLDITVDPTEIELRKVVGGVAEETLSITNNGALDIELGDITFTGPFGFGAGSDISNMTVESGDTIDTSVVLTTDSIGDYEGKMSIPVVSPVDGDLAVDLTGLVEAAPSASPEVRRLHGLTRYSTAVAIAREAYDPAGDRSWTGVTDIVIASGETRASADPLAASGMCWIHDAPLFLVSSTEVSAEVEKVVAEIVAANGTATVHIVGGTTSVPDARFAELAAAVGPGKVVKDRVIKEGTRYDMAAAIARRVKAANGGVAPDAVLIANGADESKFFDALALSTITASKGYPILLVSAGEVPSATRSVLREFAPDDVVVAGGTASVSSRVAVTVGSTARWSGANRFSTAVAIADEAVARGWLQKRTVGVASRLADATTGGSVCGRLEGAIMLTRDKDLPSETSAWLAANRSTIENTFVFGGPDSVTEQVKVRIASILK